MHQPRLVGALHRPGQLLCQQRRFADWQWLAGDLLSQIAARTKFLAEVEQAPMLADLVDLHHIRVLQPGGGLSLAAEALPPCGPGVVGVQDHLRPPPGSTLSGGPCTRHPCRPAQVPPAPLAGDKERFRRLRERRRGRRSFCAFSARRAPLIRAMVSGGRRSGSEPSGSAWPPRSVGRAGACGRTGARPWYAGKRCRYSSEVKIRLRPTAKAILRLDQVQRRRRRVFGQFGVVCEVAFHAGRLAALEPVVQVGMHQLDQQAGARRRRRGSPPAWAAVPLARRPRSVRAPVPGGRERQTTARACSGLTWTLFPWLRACSAGDSRPEFVQGEANSAC